MPIPFSKYINIVSGVEGSETVGVRQLWSRIFTSNPLVPVGTIVEFKGGPLNALAAVGAYFGSASVEYLRAAFYFAFISKSIGQAQGISFARWASVAAAPQIFGDPGLYTAAGFGGITNGTLTLTLGGTSHAFTGLNFSTAVTLANVATIMQTAINGYGAGGAQFTGATVVYDPVGQRFTFTGGVTGAATISVTDGAMSPAAALGWITGAVLSPGTAAETITNALNNTTQVSDNFGWVNVMPTMAESDYLAAAAWASASDCDFGFSAGVSATNAAQWSADSIGFGGTALNLAPLSTEYPDMVPGMICAATDYNKRGASQNYMYQQFPLTPSVTDGTSSNNYDGLRVNYYGETMNAGQLIEFYQRGILMGGATSPTDMNVYSNEMWLRSAAKSALMSLMLALPEIPANASGRRIVLGGLQSVIQQALFNGVISAGKTLTTAQQAAVTSNTGDPNAWQQVQNIGYWVDCTITPVTGPDNTTEYAAQYTLVYSKDDTVRTINGTHVLI